jgi:hypothetical protein
MGQKLPLGPVLAFFGLLTGGRDSGIMITFIQMPEYTTLESL